MQGVRVVMCVAMLGIATQAGAQDAPLVTDRPDFTESSEVVGVKQVQFESGFSYASAGHAGSITVPSALARIGVARRLELRFGTDGYLSQGDGPSHISGLSDVELGVKVRLFDATTTGVDIAVIPMCSLPTGSRPISAGHPDPTIKFTWARELASGFDLSGNYNLSALSAGDHRFTQQALSASLGHDLPLGLGGYLEVFGFMPATREGEAGWTIDGGVSRQVHHHLQFDAEAGRGLTAAAPDWFIGFGFAFRADLGR